MNDDRDTLPPEALPPPARVPSDLGDSPYARVFASMSDRVLHIHEDVRELRKEVAQIAASVSGVEVALGNVAVALATLTAALDAHRRATEELSERFDAHAQVDGHA